MAQRADSAGGHSVKWAPNTLEDGFGGDVDALDILDDNGDSGNDSDDTFERQLATHMQLKETAGVSRTDLLNPALTSESKAGGIYTNGGAKDERVDSLGGRDMHAQVAGDTASGRSSGSSRRPASAPRSRPQSATFLRSSARELSAEQEVADFRLKLQREKQGSPDAATSSNGSQRCSEPKSEHAWEGSQQKPHKHIPQAFGKQPHASTRMPLPARTKAVQVPRGQEMPASQSQPALHTHAYAGQAAGIEVAQRHGARRALSPIQSSAVQHRAGGSAISAARRLHSGSGAQAASRHRPASAAAALTSHRTAARRNTPSAVGGGPSDDARHLTSSSTAGMSVRSREALHAASSSTAGAGDDFTYGLGQEGMQRALRASLARRQGGGNLDEGGASMSLRSVSGSRRRPRSAAQVAARQARRDEKQFDATTREMATYAHQQMLLAKTQVQQANAWSEHLGLGRRYKLHVTVPAGSSTADWLKAAEKKMEADADTAKAAAFEGGEGGYEDLMAGDAAMGEAGTTRRAAATPGVPVSDAVLSNVLLSTARGGNTLRTAAGEGGARPRSALVRQARPKSAASKTGGSTAASWVPPVGGGSSSAEAPLPAGVELSSQELRVTLLDDGSVQRDVPLAMFLRGDYARLQRHIKAVATTGVLPTVPSTPKAAPEPNRSSSAAGSRARADDPRFAAKTRGGAAPGTWGRSAPLGPTKGGVDQNSGAANLKQTAFAQRVKGPASLGSDLSSKRLPPRDARGAGGGGDAASTRSATGGAKGAAEAHRSAVQAQLLAILQETATLTFCLGEQVSFLQAQGWAMDGSQSMLPSANVRDLVMED